SRARGPDRAVHAPEAVPGGAHDAAQLPAGDDRRRGRAERVLPRAHRRPDLRAGDRQRAGDGLPARRHRERGDPVRGLLSAALLLPVVLPGQVARDTTPPDRVFGVTEWQLARQKLEAEMTPDGF